MLTMGSLFSGIGGFELGLEWAGFGPTLWQVEINDYATKILEKHWPDTKRFGDVRDCGKHNLAPVGIICGGFPCQPFSVAGKRKGKEDDRYLWPEMVRIIEELRPFIVIGENVPGIINMGLDQTLSALESLDYSTATFNIPACAINAPHRRDRVWIIAYGPRSEKSRELSSSKWETISTIRKTDSDAPDTEHKGCIRRSSGSDTNSNRIQAGEQAGNKSRSAITRCDEITNTNATSKGLPRICEGEFVKSILHAQRRNWEESWAEVATRLCRVDDGVPSRVDRLKCLGNAVVPQVSQAIGEKLIEWLKKESKNEFKRHL